MNYHVSTSATTIYNVKGVSPYDAALRIVTRLASKGGIPHGVPVTVRVYNGETGWSERPEKHVDAMGCGRSMPSRAQPYRSWWSRPRPSSTSQRSIWWSSHDRITQGLVQPRKHPDNPNRNALATGLGHRDQGRMGKGPSH